MSSILSIFISLIFGRVKFVLYLTEIPITINSYLEQYYLSVQCEMYL